MSDRHGLTVSPEWVSYCINPQCQQRQNPEMGKVCQSCGTPLFVCDRYRLISPLRPLNQPTSTELFEVEDWGDNAEACNPLKVLKVLKPTDNRALIRLFEQEARVLTALKHPQLPTVEPYSPFLVTLNSGTILRCLVQQKIDGVNLEQWINQHGPISHHQALEILRQLAEILKFVHSKGFFHRDIKPANIMRCPNGKLVLIDFGTAREVTASLVEKREQQTVTRVISEGYTAPEQRQGKALPKSDLFALGRTMVYLLTGSSPLEFEDPETGELVGWQAGCPNLNPALASAINQLIHPISSQRTRNPELLLNQLDEIQIWGESNQGNNPVVEANPLPDSVIWNRIWTQIPKFIYSPVIAKIALTGLLGVAVVRGLMPLILPQIAWKINDFATKQHISDRLESAKVLYKMALIVEPEFGSAQYGLGATCEKLENFECAIAHYSEASASSSDRAASAAMNNLGRFYILNGSYEQALERLKAGLERAYEMLTKSDIHKNLGWLYWIKKDYAESEFHLKTAILLNDEKADAYCLLALVLSDMGDNIGAKNAGESCQGKRI
ncbi:protein kinase domain-containing protein [Laspinema olomoucense]|uniref:serine/threonine-protein kinase n=1 Tax=Laspinema olomoucense TaxID=3231600 RepID=UPI0021BAAD2D|nr:serine/threonine-protein kinase [Laspinema sp. D3d]MCT7974469.1 serine/threonine-protein kinase [Laspinema sp. D3d]